jgi:Protein of unknown function (DUF1761)
MTWGVLGELNWLAVVVATVVYMVLGALWYSPVLFADAWMRASGVTMPEERPGPGIFAFPGIAYLFSSIATAMIAEASGSDSLGEGLALGLVVGVGYAAASALVGATFDDKPDRGTWFAITAGFNCIALVIVALIVSLWR